MATKHRKGPLASNFVTSDVGTWQPLASEFPHDRGVYEWSALGFCGEASVRMRIELPPRINMNYFKIFFMHHNSDLRMIHLRNSTIGGNFPLTDRGAVSLLVVCMVSSALT